MLFHTQMRLHTLVRHLEVVLGQLSWTMCSVLEMRGAFLIVLTLELRTVTAHTQRMQESAVNVSTKTFPQPLLTL